MRENINSFVPGFVPSSSDDNTPNFFSFFFFAIITRSGDNCEGGDVKREFKTAISYKMCCFSGIKYEDVTLLWLLVSTAAFCDVTKGTETCAVTVKSLYGRY